MELIFRLKIEPRTAQRTKEGRENGSNTNPRNRKAHATIYSAAVEGEEVENQTEHSEPTAATPEPGVTRGFAR